MRLSKLDLIELKLLNKASESQERDFVNLLHTDTVFAKEYALRSSLFSFISDEINMDFRKKLDSVYDDYSSKKSIPVISLKNTWSYVASIAAVVIIAFGGYYLLNQDSTTDELYQKYYQLDDVYLNTRSGNTVNTDLLEQGLILFEKNKYEESISYFKQLPTSITATYYSGVAYMELNEYDVAVYKFNQVINDNLNVFYDQAKWYKSLCLLKLNKEEEAKGILRNISKTTSYYNTQAKELLKELK